MKKGLNAAQLKMIAVIAMVCDHIVPFIHYTESINLCRKAERREI